MLSALFNGKKQEYYTRKRWSLIRRWLEDGADRPVEDGADRPVEDGADRPVEDSANRPVEDGANRPVEVEGGCGPNPKSNLTF